MTLSQKGVRKLLNEWRRKNSSFALQQIIQYLLEIGHKISTYAGNYVPNKGSPYFLEECCESSNKNQKYLARHNHKASTSFPEIKVSSFGLHSSKIICAAALFADYVSLTLRQGSILPYLHNWELAIDASQLMSSIFESKASCSDQIHLSLTAHHPPGFEN
ncbi:hypothetical protein MJO28_006130 [Puccinia striiformis f. sp. tritici]|uniref:Uncharacterized protein n=1 Tax=Puccinia striiformis f. sp. tritici TaxID=168172 RepID=A0ACC0EG92_9BASI|nr:hypothetical protein MJO28_006130 [Puccinia striiformis f. sp. tritici]